MIDSADTAGVAGTALVLFMTLPGRTFEGGRSRREPGSGVMQCFAIVASLGCSGLLGGLQTLLQRYAPWLGNLDKGLLFGVGRDAADPNTKIPETYSSCSADLRHHPPALIRSLRRAMRFTRCSCFTTTLGLVLVYVSAHWVWGGGLASWPSRGAGFRGGFRGGIPAGMSRSSWPLIGRGNGFQ